MRVLPVFMVFVACRPDPGAPSYPRAEAWDPVLDDSDFLGGSDPYDGSSERLSLGIFYEGGASEVLEIDDATRHFYIYEGTFSLEVTDDRVEGLVADAVTLSGGAWWGGGVHWDVPVDLSAWTTLHLAVASPDEGLAGWQLGMSDGTTEARVTAADYGFATDGAWRHLAVPLADFSGLDLTRVAVPLLLVGQGGTAGDTLKLDDLYLSKEAP